MKRLWNVMILACLLLAACATPAADPAPTAAVQGDSGDISATAAPSTDRCGDRTKLAREIQVYTWVEYFDPQIKSRFEGECGVHVVETNFDSNETLLATLQSGATGYDVIMPSDYMVQIMVSEGMLEPLDFNIITNIQYMNPLNVHQYFDPDQKYSVPFDWGTSGLIVDTSVVANPEASWKLVFDADPAVCGKISMLDDQRETLGAALMYLGYGINDTDPAHLDEAKNLLIAQAPCVKAYDSQTNDDLAVSGETIIGHIWTGDAILAGDPDTGGRAGLEYVIPKEGCTIWQDNMAVPTSAPNKYTAMIFINYMSDPQIAAQNITFIGYGSPNDAAKALLADDIINNKGIYPDADTMSKLQWIQDVGDALELYDRVWTEFKAAIGG